MDQLPTLMVSGDMDAANADITQQQQRRSRQSTAGNSSSRTQYRTAPHGDGDIEFEEDEGRSGAPYTNPTGLGLHDSETSCSRGNGTTDDRRQDEESDTDGAGHCSGELGCNPSMLESWTRTVHQHRTGLVGNGRASAGSSGKEPARGRGNIPQQLERIMDTPYDESMLRSMRRYLAEMDNVDSSVRTTTRPPVCHNWRPTWGGHNSNSHEAEREASDDDGEVVISPELRRRAANLGYGTSASPAVSPERPTTTTPEAEARRGQDSQAASMMIEDQRRPSPASSESTVSRGGDATRPTRREDRVTFDSLPRPRRLREITDDGDHRGFAPDVRRRPASQTTTREVPPSSDIEVPSSGSSSVVSTPGQPRLRSVVIPVLQHQRNEPLRRGISSVSTTVKSHDDGSPEQDGTGADRAPDPVRRRQPPDDDGGGGGSSSSSSDDDGRKYNGGRKREKREDSDEERKGQGDRGRRRKRRQSASHRGGDITRTMERSLLKEANEMLARQLIDTPVTANTGNRSKSRCTTDRHVSKCFYVSSKISLTTMDGVSTTNSHTLKPLYQVQRAI